MAGRYWVETFEARAAELRERMARPGKHVLPSFLRERRRREANLEESRRKDRERKRRWLVRRGQHEHSA